MQGSSVKTKTIKTNFFKQCKTKSAIRKERKESYAMENAKEICSFRTFPLACFLSLSPALSLASAMSRISMRKYPSKFLKAARLLDVWQCAMCKVHNDASCSLFFLYSLPLSFFLLFNKAFDMLNLTLTFPQEEIIEMRLETAWRK